MLVADALGSQRQLRCLYPSKTMETLSCAGPSALVLRDEQGLLSPQLSLDSSTFLHQVVYEPTLKHSGEPPHTRRINNRGVERHKAQNKELR